MTTITQDIRYCLSLIKYAEKHGVSKAVRKYHTNRQAGRLSAVSVTNV